MQTQIGDAKDNLRSPVALLVYPTPFTGFFTNVSYIRKDHVPDLWIASGVQTITSEKHAGFKNELVEYISHKDHYVRDFLGSDLKEIK
ncbi:MAG: hypothetical protein ACOYKD_07100 [Anaerolineaceae bacterium]|jgi:ATP-dependent phosphoenolpyruvate carboxykinase